MHTMRGRRATAALLASDRVARTFSGMSQAPGRTSDAGFTLVEILVAIVLTGILATVAVVGIGRLTGAGSAAACTASSDAARAGTSVHFAATGSQPTSMSQMVNASPPALSFDDGVELDATGLVAVGSGWTLTMTPGVGGAAPSFACTGADDTGGLAADPPVTAGLIAWYDASDPSTISTSGTRVTQWDDKSGNGNHARASIGTVTVASGARNGHDVIRFDGASTLRAPHSASLDLRSNTLTIAVVYRSTVVNGNWAFVNKENTWEVGERGSGGGFTAAVRGGCWTWVGSVPAASATWHTATFRYTPTWRFDVDGGPMVTAAAPCSGDIIPTTSGLTLGGRGDGLTATLTGEIAEVLIYGTALSDAETRALSAHLAAKWGLP